MARREEDKQVNVSMSAEAKDELKEFCEANGISMNDAMNRARELLLVDALRVKAPEQAPNIEDFELLVNKLLGAYKGAIERCVNADELAQLKVKNQLEGIKTLAETNKNLRDELESEKNANSELKKKLDEAQKRIAQLEKAEKESEDINALKREKMDLEQELINLKKAHADEIKKLQDENFEKIIKLVTATNK